MSLYTNICSGPTTSTEVTTAPTLTLFYVTKNDFSTKISSTIKNLPSNFKETIADQDAKFDAKPEKQLQTLLLHIKEDYTNFY